MWALQQPLDKVVFGCGYDDVELLGRAVGRESGWYSRGLLLHVQNGAVFGAVYANIAPALPVPPALRGPAAALTEHLALWPLSFVSDRWHPARGDLPTLGGNRPAVAPATRRPLLVGLVVGAHQRRLNAEPEPAPPQPDTDYTSNGHGSLEHGVYAAS